MTKLWLWLAIHHLPRRQESAGTATRKVIIRRTVGFCILRKRRSDEWRNRPLTHNRTLDIDPRRPGARPNNGTVDGRIHRGQEQGQNNRTGIYRGQEQGQKGTTRQMSVTQLCFKPNPKEPPWLSLDFCDFRAVATHQSSFLNRIRTGAIRL
jgi:hypothetical protein